MDKQQFEDLVAKLGEEAAKKIKAEFEALETKNAETLKSLVTKAEFSQKLADLQAKVDASETAQREQGVKIVELESAAKATDEPVKTLKGQIKSWMEENKDAIDTIKNGGKASLTGMSLKVAITMTEAASLNSSAYLPNPVREPGIIDLVRLQPTFWDRLSKGRTSGNPYIWVNKYNKQGNATFIGEGTTKALASFELQSQTSTPKKVAEAMKASRELLYDLEGMETFIREELAYEVKIAANTAVLTGTASDTSPAGVTTIASAYNLTTVETTNPNNSDAIRAAIAQIRTLNFYGILTAYVSPVDYANMDLEKAQDSGVYMLAPFTSADGRIIAGVQVIEDNGITPGYLLVGDMRLYRILMFQDFFVEMGWENDDFRKNLVTFIGEMRFHQFYSSNHVGAWVYDTFANIKSAITAI